MDGFQQEVYKSIRTQLLSGKWSAGQRLREGTLAAELRVKRHPVREALFRLSSEGLLERQTGLGCRVARADAETVEHLWELRESVEGMAARLAAKRMDTTQLLRMEHEHEIMQRLVSQGQELALSDCENRFHGLLLESSGNPALREVWNQYLVRAIVAQLSLIPRYENIDAVYLETFRGHERIIAALRNRDAAAAEAAARAHITEGREHMMLLFTQDVSHRTEVQVARDVDGGD